MNKFELKSPQDIEDFLTGCAFFGTGGGGSVENGRVSLNLALDKGYSLTLTSPDDIEDDVLYCSAFFMGSIAPKSPQILKEMEQNGFRERKYCYHEMLVQAVRNLEQYLGKKMSGLLVVELGGSNSACCMAAAYEMGIPVIDADFTGRAVPEMTHGLPAIMGKSCLPASYVDSWGNSNLTTSAFGYTAMERIGKMLSEASYGEMAEAAYALNGREMRQILVPHTLSQSLKVGQCIRKALENDNNPCLAGAMAAGGALLGKFRISSVIAENRDGYYWGTYELEGLDDCENKTYKIWFKNENHVLWENERPIATSPDMIVLLNWRTGAPISNTYLCVDEEVGIIIVPARDQYLSQQAIASFGPRAFGFDFDYEPYKKIIR